MWFKWGILRSRIILLRQIESKRRRRRIALVGSFHWNQVWTQSVVATGWPVVGNVEYDLPGFTLSWCWKTLHKSTAPSSSLSCLHTRTRGTSKTKHTDLLNTKTSVPTANTCLLPPAQQNILETMSVTELLWDRIWSPSLAAFLVHSSLVSYTGSPFTTMGIFQVTFNN